MSFSKFPHFQPLSVTDAAQHREYYSLLKQPYCDFSLDDMLIWLNFNDDLRVSDLNGNLFISFTNVLDNHTRCYSLLGTRNMERTIDDLIIYFQNASDPLRLTYITKDTANAIKRLKRADIKIESDPANSDYVYNVDDLLAMHGKPYENLRRRVNYFKRKNPNVAILEFNLNREGDIRIIKTAINEWVSKGISLRNDPEKWDSSAIEKHLSLAKDLPSVHAYGVLSGNELVNVNIFHLPPQKDWLIFNHIKCDYSYEGVYGYAFYTLFTIAKSKGIKWVNFEQDLGIEGLKQIKSFFRPEMQLPRYTVSLERKNQ